MNNLTKETGCWRGVTEKVKQYLISNQEDLGDELITWQVEKERLAEEKNNLQCNLVVRLLRSLSIKLLSWEASGKITRRIHLLRPYNEIITFLIYDDDPRNTALIEIKDLCIQHMIRWSFSRHAWGAMSREVKRKESQLDRVLEAYRILEKGLSESFLTTGIEAY